MDGWGPCLTFPVPGRILPRMLSPTGARTGRGGRNPSVPCSDCHDTDPLSTSLARATVAPAGRETVPGAAPLSRRAGYPRHKNGPGPPSRRRTGADPRGGCVSRSRYASKLTSLPSLTRSSATSATTDMTTRYQPTPWMPKASTSAVAIVGAKAPPRIEARLYARPEPE